MSDNDERPTDDADQRAGSVCAHHPGPTVVLRVGDPEMRLDIYRARICGQPGHLSPHGRGQGYLADLPDYPSH
jgi:hypothetical protein